MAVFTPVSDADLVRLLADYDLGAARRLDGIATGWENSNFSLETDRGAYILTVFEKRVVESDLPFFLGLLEHLRRRGIPCPPPVRRRDGALWGHVAGKPAAIVGFLSGADPRDPGPDACFEAGVLLARLPAAADGFAPRRANALAPATWPGLVAALAPRAESVASGLGAELAAEAALPWPDDLPRGLIHGDLFPDNTFFRDGRLVGVIDFYFACEEVLLFDLAVALNAWAFNREGRFLPANARALVAGYQSVRPLEGAEKAALAHVARGVALRFLLTRLQDWLDRPDDALVDPKDPLEYLDRLRFHRAVAGPSVYGVD